MRIHRRTAAAVTTALIGSFMLIGTATGTATAEETTSVALPSASFGDIVVDGVHDRVFVSDPSGGTVVVTDYAGTVVRQITAEEGAAGLALSADSGTLYVALSTVGAIAEIDTATLTETHRYPTGTDTSPQSLAMAGGKLWFGYTVGSSGGIGSLDVPPPPRRRRSSRAAGTGTTPRPWPRPPPPRTPWWRARRGSARPPWRSTTRRPAPLRSAPSAVSPRRPRSRTSTTSR